jgi:hypothetical protein
MAGEPNPQTTFTQVSATAVASQGRWLICLVGAPEISVELRRLADVDRAMAEILARDLGRSPPTHESTFAGTTPLSPFPGGERCQRSPLGGGISSSSGLESRSRPRETGNPET